MVDTLSVHALHRQALAALAAAHPATAVAVATAAGSDNVYTAWASMTRAGKDVLIYERPPVAAPLAAPATAPADALVGRPNGARFGAPPGGGDGGRGGWCGGRGGCGGGGGAGTPAPREQRAAALRDAPPSVVAAATAHRGGGVAAAAAAAATAAAVGSDGASELPAATVSGDAWRRLRLLRGRDVGRMTAVAAPVLGVRSGGVKGGGGTRGG